jgi:transketolase
MYMTTAAGARTTCTGSSVLDDRSIALRESIIDALVGGRRGHVGSALSLVEILRVLYDEVLALRPGEPQWPLRDRCILSKGHGCLALYAVLADKGFFAREHLLAQCTPDALLGGHPELHIPGVEASTGALGHGLPIGVGSALAARLAGRSNRVFVVMGDGELNEGSVWEAALIAAKHRLTGLVAIVDYNKQQSYGPVDTILPLEPLADKWRAFGFSVRECDGHDVGALARALTTIPFAADGPSVLIAHTVKGRGIDFAEHDPHWHHKASFDAEQGELLRAALRRN